MITECYSKQNEAIFDNYVLGENISLTPECIFNNAEKFGIRIRRYFLKIKTYIITCILQLRDDAPYC